MATNISIIRAAVRKDLHDEDAAAYVWTDAVLDRHIGRAVTDYSVADPLEVKSTLSTTAASRDLSVASLVPLVGIDAVEWPVGEFPPMRVGYSLWADTLTMDVVAAPSSVQNAYVYWLKQHTLDAGSSTIPAADDDLIALGAAGYAALDRAVYAVNKINTGGADVWGRYKSFGDASLAQFRQELHHRGRSNAVRQRRMFSTDAPSVFEQSRVKY
jgi:hypothetical protein